MSRESKVLDPAFKKRVDSLIKDLRLSLHELHDAATRDQKTGLYNYQFFKNIFVMELEKAKRGLQDLSVIGIDIDFFKKFNDTYGHLVGDKVLVELGKVLQFELRKYDVLSRFGGEEFFILLPQTKRDVAVRVAERLRKSLQKSSLLSKYSVTISLGVTSYKLRDSFDRMLKRCDAALYASKKSGRNTVSVK